VDLDQTDMSMRKRRLTFISLAPTPTYGRFIESIRDLKARGICNVVIRENDAPEARVGNGRNALTIPALVLCGNSIGDAGFDVSLPPDGPLRL
jgi:hypothetical protein